MNIRFLGLWLKHAKQMLRRGSWSFLLATLTIGLGLYLISIFTTVSVNVERFAAHMGQGIHAVAFLSTADAMEAEEVAAQLEQLAEVESAVSVTPEQAMAELRDGLQDESPLRKASEGISLGWSVDVKLRSNANESAHDSGGNMSATIKKLAVFPGVEEVIHPGQEIQQLGSLFEFVKKGGRILWGLIVLVTVLIITSTLRLAFVARKNEIEIMKLVGATDTFVAIPFMITGGFLGFMGALLGVGAAYLSRATLAKGLVTLFDFPDASIVAMPYAFAVTFVLIAALLGSLAALLALARSLRV